MESTNRNQIRSENDKQAKEQIAGLRREAEYKKSTLHKKSEPRYPLGGCATFLLLVLTAGVGVVILLIVHGVKVAGVRAHNRSIDEECARIDAKLEADIKALCAKADELTEEQIKQYNDEVSAAREKILAKKEVLDSIVERMTQQFNNRISHTDAANNVRFIETQFIFCVLKDRIEFIYPSTYTNEYSDIDFDRERYKPLKKESECEALAMVLSELVRERIVEQYSPVPVTVDTLNNDSYVTMNFKMANPNFVNSVSFL